MRKGTKGNKGVRKYKSTKASAALKRRKTSDLSLEMEKSPRSTVCVITSQANYAACYLSL